MFLEWSLNLNKFKQLVNIVVKVFEFKFLYFSVIERVLKVCQMQNEDRTIVFSSFYVFYFLVYFELGFAKYSP